MQRQNPAPAHRQNRALAGSVGPKFGRTQIAPFCTAPMAKGRAGLSRRSSRTRAPGTIEAGHAECHTHRRRVRHLGGRSICRSDPNWDLGRLAAASIRPGAKPKSR
jgi:hypothetical protein